MRLEGEQLGHYRLTHFIQSGGMGEIYLAEDLTLSRQVAIKVMKTEPVLYPNAQASKDAARLFQREMQAISMLDHAHILTLLEAGEQQIDHDNVAYMVMPYCPEGSLADWICHYHSTQSLSPDEVAQLLQQAADALQYAHDQKPQVLHLDIKPSNFLVRRQQDPSQLPNLLLADFGVAKMATTSKLSGTVRGTLEYMAPEQLAGTPVAASDQYALGIMIYELLTGRTPFQGTLPQAIPHMHANVDPKPPSEVNSPLSPALDKVVLRALTKKPQDRFASVKDFASAFAAALKPSANQPDKMQKPTLSYEPVEAATRQARPQHRSLQAHKTPPQSRPSEARQQHISPQQKGQLSPQAYQLATTYKLGTPLDEFKIVYRKSYIFLGIFLPLEAVGLLIAVGSEAAGIAGLLIVLAIAVTGSLAGVTEAVLTLVGSILILAIYGLVVSSGLLILIISAVSLAAIVSLAGGVWFIWYPKFHHYWRVYLCSDGFIYTHGKKIDVFPWHQIRMAEKYQSTYTVIRRDSKKVVLNPCFQSIEYLGEYIIREYKHVNKPS